MRTLIFGDIHGGLKALEQLLEKANVTESDKLIFLGDYVDGWCDSVGVMEFLLRLGEKQECIFIKGNHDIWCEKYLKTGIVNQTWLMHGGALTYENYERQNQALRNDHLEFLESMPFYHISEANDLFIHAGFTSMHGPEREFHKSNYNWDRTLWEMAVTMDARIKKDSLLYPKRLKLYREIYIGHTPTIRLGEAAPMHAVNVWNLDTGAAFDGKLSCIDLETKQIYQSDRVWDLYPDESGRNS